MDIRSALSNFLGEKRALVNAITREFRDGTPAKTIAREVAEAFSRDQVTQYLAAVALADAASKALQEAQLGGVASAWVTGIDPPREAHLAISTDPAEAPDSKGLPGSDYAGLPSRIRAALRDFHITLDLPRAGREEHGILTAELIDKLLLDGEPVRLVKLKPRT
jgi:hypothetical protein